MRMDAAGKATQIRSRARHGLTRREKDDVVYYTVPALDETGVFSFIFTTRLGGVSSGCFSSLNLSVSREPDAANKRQNYIRAAKCAGVDPMSLVLVNYKHGTGIACVTAANRGDGLRHQTTLPPCDAIVVRDPDVTAMTLHADCVPVIVADPIQRIGALAHAGWRGTVSGLPGMLIQTFIDQFDSDPGSLICAVGPHIKDCCFEVGEEVSDRFAEKFGPDSVVCSAAGKPHVDLEAAVLLQLVHCGVVPENITVADLCTSCEEQLFYSYRRDRGQTGAMAAMMRVLPL